MARVVGIFVLALLVGCYSEENFNEEYSVAICEKVFECSDDSVLPFLPYDDVDGCVAYRTGEETEDDNEDGLSQECRFNGTTAQDCVEQTTALSCDAYEDGEFPTVCAQVCESADD